MISENKFVGNNLGKLYLNTSTADVFFEFRSRSNCIERVPAHRSLLAAGSPRFQFLLYGRFKDTKIIQVGDANAESFKVFLQFFYLNEVKLTPDNYSDIAVICERFQVNDCFKKCLEVKKLALDDICLNYRFAVEMNNYNDKREYEKELLKNPGEILKSKSFLDCNKFTFGKILELFLSRSVCDALQIVEASINWASAECKRKKLDETEAKNLRIQLGDLLKKIPFGELSIEQFSTYAKKHKKLFTASDFRRIIRKISKRPVPAIGMDEASTKGETTTSTTTVPQQNVENLPKPKENLSTPKEVYPIPQEIWNTIKDVAQLTINETYYCFRRTSYTRLQNLSSVSNFRDIFSTNKRFLLTDIKFLNCLWINFKLNFKVMNVDTNECLTSGEINCDKFVTLDKPIIIEPGTKYSILTEYQSSMDFAQARPERASDVMRCNASGVEITFDSRLKVVVAAFKFQKAFHF